MAFPCRGGHPKRYLYWSLETSEVTLRRDHGPNQTSRLHMSTRSRRRRSYTRWLVCWLASQLVKSGFAHSAPALPSCLRVRDERRKVKDERAGAVGALVRCLVSGLPGKPGNGPKSSSSAFQAPALRLSLFNASISRSGHTRWLVCWLASQLVKSTSANSAPALPSCLRVFV